MHIQHISSHLNGEEFLLVHKVALYKQLKETIEITPTKDLLAELKSCGWAELSGHKRQPYFVKERVAIEVCSDIFPFEPFGKHLALYVDDQIDVGIEILPMKTMQSQMSSGVAYYEGELYNVVRNGRGVPAVPLVILGIDA